MRGSFAASALCCGRPCIPFRREQCAWVVRIAYTYRPYVFTVRTHHTYCSIRGSGSRRVSSSPAADDSLVRSAVETARSDQSTHCSLFARLRAPPLARWQSGHAAACKAVYAGSIPTLASRTCFCASFGVSTPRRLALVAAITAEEVLAARATCRWQPLRARWGAVLSRAH